MIFFLISSELSASDSSHYHIMCAFFYQYTMEISTLQHLDEHIMTSPIANKHWSHDYLVHMT